MSFPIQLPRVDPEEFENNGDRQGEEGDHVVLANVIDWDEEVEEKQEEKALGEKLGRQLRLQDFGAEQYCGKREPEQP